MKNSRLVAPRFATALAVPVFAAAVLLLMVCALFSGCYTLKQGTTMLGYLGRAVPLEELERTAAALPAGENGEAEKNRRFAELVRDIRRFAVEELGLKESKNYTKYVGLDRSYLAAVVSASAQDSFARHEWHYLVVGAMPYKGFFDVADARKERAKLEKKGLDVWVRAVDAFSTLGWFRDPLYSYMRDYPPQRLADLIIHEMFHATLFIKGQVSFNEGLAELVGSKGALRYMESRYGVESEQYRAMFGGEDDSRAYVAFLRELAAELQQVYAGDSSREEKINEKARVIAAAKERFAAEYDSRFSGDDYRGFVELPVNNAFLELYRLYYTEDNFFEKLYERSGGDITAVVAAAKTLKKGRGDPRIRLEKALGINGQP